MISRKEILESLDYSPETGRFVWRKNTGRAVAGDQAGCRKGDGYIVIRFKGKLYRAHRLAWFLVNGDWPEAVDHINHNKADNRIKNLRRASKKINGRNLGLQANNKSGICGVHFNNGWIAQIKHNGQNNHLKYTQDFFEACCARKAAEARLGFHPNHGKTLC